MAIVECGHCGWTEEIPEDADIEVIEATAMTVYAMHMWEVHPHRAPFDVIASAWIAHKAAIVAKANGHLAKGSG